MIRLLSALALLCAFALAQPTYFGNIQTRNIQPRAGSTFSLGTTGNRYLGLWSDGATITSNLSVGGVLSLPNTTGTTLEISSTDAQAIRILNGGGSALTWYASSALNTTGNVNVGTTIFGLSTVIDNTKNGYFNNITLSGTCTGCGSTTPGGSGSELQFRSGASTFGAVSSSSVSGANVNLGGVLSLTNTTGTTLSLSSTAGNAINILNGGGSALSWFGSSSISTTGSVFVGPSVFSLVAVIDNAGNLTPYSNYGSDVGGSSNRYNRFYGRFSSLRTNGANLASQQILDNSGVPVFLMGDTGLGAGELRVYDAGAEKFAVYGGQTNITTTNIALTGNVTHSGGNFSASVGSGNFYLRNFTGAPSCSGVANGWIGVDTTGGTVGRVYVCISSTARYVDLN